MTLTGPGGTGKTRLALAATDDQRAAFVDLSAVTDARLVLSTIVHALGTGETPGQDELETLVTALGERSGVLVLDNFEQVLDAAPTLRVSLPRHPRLRSSSPVALRYGSAPSGRTRCHRSRFHPPTRRPSRRSSALRPRGSTSSGRAPPIPPSR